MDGRSLNIVVGFVGEKGKQRACRGQAGSSINYPKIPNHPPFIFLVFRNEPALSNYPIYCRVFSWACVGPSPQSIYVLDFSDSVPSSNAILSPGQAPPLFGNNVGFCRYLKVHASKQKDLPLHHFGLYCAYAYLPVPFGFLPACSK